MDGMDTRSAVAALAVESMLYEVAATPKPGLVDRVNNGAHHDMDYFTFMSSTAALHMTFDRILQKGEEYSGKDIQELLPALRGIGAEEEKKMFLFTDGVNTHKGMIFSLGILCGCVGWLLGRQGEALNSERICECAARLCEGICDRDFAGLKDKSVLTKGERMYLDYGIRGVRGIAESGYEVVREISLPVYTILRHADISVNDALVHTLLYLIADTEDTNIASRHNRETMCYAQDCARNVLAAGGMLSEKGRAGVRHMDEDFIEKYISPGGCADLLAVTHFLYNINEAGITVR